MRLFLAFLLVGACGGPSQKQLVETPAATAPWRHAEAPPASTSDEDRHHLNQQFEDMEVTQEAYREAEQESAPPPKAAPAPNPRKAPVEQAPSPKKKAPVKVAPR